MPKKRYKAEEIVTKLRQVDVLVSQGSSVAAAIRQIGVSEVTYYRWRQEFGGLKTAQVKRLRDRLKRDSHLARGVIQAGYVDPSDARPYGRDREEDQALSDRSD